MNNQRRDVELCRPRVLQQPASRDRGAILAISLVLLMILTLLAISTMRTATLELAMAGNAQVMEKAFQSAQTGLAVAVARINNDELALGATDGWVHEDAVTGADDAGNAYAIGVRYLYRGEPPHDTDPEIRALYFEMESTGTTRARNAKSVQTRGFWVPASGGRPINLTYWFPHATP